MLFVAALLSSVALFGGPPASIDLTMAFRTAGADIDNLQAIQVGEVVVLRGRTTDRARALEAGIIAKKLGYSRVANLIQLIEPVDDERIERMAERELTIHRSLDGCTLSVDSDHGIVRLVGRVHSELQKDVAVGLIRTIAGVRAVRADLKRF